MKITHYLYNAFLLEADGAKVAIDPGQNLWLFKLESLIPESEWPSITHLVITHGDPDHHWQSDRVARASGAHVICGRDLTRIVDGSRLVVDPRGRALRSWMPFENLHALAVGDSIKLDGVSIEAVKTEHGPIAIPILGFTLRAQPGLDERVGLGAMGFKIMIGDKSLLNLGDSVLLPEWKNVTADVLMLPIGGLGQNTWTMDVDEALEAVKLISPTYVIPCHYNVPLFWKRKFAPADDRRFKREVERLGAKCAILHYGEALSI
jgi:L-ascorbate metabolism protein UlaG (beta-lactamase superfamily)